MKQLRSWKISKKPFLESGRIEIRRKGINRDYYRVKAAQDIKSALKLILIEFQVQPYSSIINFRQPLTIITQPPHHPITQYIKNITLANKQMINQKLIQKAIYSLQKALQAIYFFGSLWIGIIFICTIPIWAPLYLLTASMCRSLNFMKRIIELPKELFRPELTEPVRYAVLKKNGTYLRNTLPEEDVFLYQLYDYAMRKFLSVEEIDPKTKIAEIECETLAQWKYFKANGLASVTCLQSKPQILDKQKQSCPSIEVKRQSYGLQEFSNDYETIIALNLKQKLNKYSNHLDGQQKVDILKILGYIRHHLSQKGYAIFGDFFEEQGEVKVLEELFNVYGFHIEEFENIQKNITYAEKLLTYKAKHKKYWEQEALEKIAKKIKQFTGVKRDYTQKYFAVFILTKANPTKPSE